LSLLVRYLNKINIYAYLTSPFGSIRKNAKGQPVAARFKQIFCFWLDGTSRHLVYFDTLKRDGGYAATIETAPEDLLSSRAVKRFFHAFLSASKRMSAKRWCLWKPTPPPCGGR